MAPLDGGEWLASCSREECLGRKIFLVKLYQCYLKRYFF